MHRNHMLRNQLVSTLNPDSRYNVLFKHDTQKNPRIQYQQKSCQGSMKIKTQTTTQQKGKFLTLVSKPKKGMKKGKSNKKNLLKKSNSVILGGIKQSKNLTVQSEHSIQRSRCKSCTNFNLTNQNPTLKSQTNIQTSTNNNFNQRNIPMNLITQPNENNLQLTKIISHKLKMDTVQPHQFFTQRIILNSGQINNICGGFERRLLRNVSTGSVDRVYFSVGDEKKQEIKHSNQGLRLRNQKIFSTPRFDQTQQKEVQRKRRSRAGFIRSASAHKASPQQQKKISPMQSHKTSQFSPIQSISTQTINLNKPSTPKQQQIDQCISKMSLIRKQIDQIQSMIHQRLQSSQLRTKLMYGPQTPRVVKNQNVHNQRQQHRLFTHRGQQSKGLGQGHDNFNKKNIDNILNNNNSRILLSQSRTATIVNQLDNLSRSLSMSKCALIQSSKIQQRKNTNNNNLLNKNNILNLGEICNLIKHPQDKRTNGLLLSQQLIQKQYVGQSKTAASVRDRNVIDYQIDNNNNFKNSYNNNNNNFINNNNNFINNNNFLTMTKDKNYNQQNTLITKKNHFNNNSITNMTYNSTNNNHHPIIFNRLR